MLTRILAFRPASVTGRLGPRSAACPLSLRDLLGPAAEQGIALPLVQAPRPAVARAALVAAKLLRSPVGLGLPAGEPPEAVVRGGGARRRRARRGAAHLPGRRGGAGGRGHHAGRRRPARRRRGSPARGLTHLAVDAIAVAPQERARLLAEVAARRGRAGHLGRVRGAARGGGRLGAGGRGAARGAGRARPVAGPRERPLPAPAGVEEARRQVSALARLGAALAGVPVLRRGPTSPELLGLLPGSAVRACDDGGAAARGSRRRRRGGRWSARAGPAPRPSRPPPRPRTGWRRAPGSRRWTSSRRSARPAARRRSRGRSRRASRTGRHDAHHRGGGPRPPAGGAGGDRHPAHQRQGPGAVFNVLGQFFGGGEVLDVYAGTGALALEALSRGCARAVCVEADRDVAELLRRNAARLRVRGAGGDPPRPRPRGRWGASPRGASSSPSSIRPTQRRPGGRAGGAGRAPRAGRPGRGRARRPPPAAGAGRAARAGRPARVRRHGDLDLPPGLSDTPRPPWPGARSIPAPSIPSPTVTWPSSSVA